MGGVEGSEELLRALGLQVKMASGGDVVQMAFSQARASPVKLVNAWKLLGHAGI